MEPAVIIKKLGHDGTEVLWPQLPNEFRYKQFSIQEIVDVFLTHGIALVCIEADPFIAPNRCACPHAVFSHPVTRFKEYLKKYDALIFGTQEFIKHTWVWKNQKCYDANNQYDIEKIEILEMYILSRTS